MIITSRVTQDNGVLDRIRRIGQSTTGGVEVGYFGNKSHRGANGRTPITQVARAHELGKGVPKRAFIEPALETNRRKYLSIMASQITPMLRGAQTMRNVWGLIGATAVGDVQQYMVTAQFTPLSPITIARKGSSRALIDTGQLRQSITYRVK